MTSTETLRRNLIADSLRELIEKGEDYSVAQLLETVKRKKNFKDKTKTFYDQSDVDVATAIQLTIEDIQE